MSTRAPARGFTLIEVLIAIVVLAFGLLALARAHAGASLSEVEVRQRTQAMALVGHLAARIDLNRRNAASYVGEFPGSTLDDCTTPLTLAARDLCEWQHQLAGEGTTDGARNIGAPMAAMGCVLNTEPNVYVIVVAWQGVVETGAPASPCGEGAFASEETRRTFSSVVQIATLGT